MRVNSYTFAYVLKETTIINSVSGAIVRTKFIRPGYQTPRICASLVETVYNISMWGEMAALKGWVISNIWEQP